MAIVENGPKTAEACLEQPASWIPQVSWELAAYAVLVVFAFVIRFWDLGTRMLHHDESLHAVYSYYLYVGRGYRHDPMMHGPFQFHAMALGYFLLGVSDATARVMPALFGTVLVGLPYFLRRQLGRTAALVAAFLLAVSPSFLYFSRFARNDIYIAVWTTLMVILIFGYLEKRRAAYLYGLAAVLSLSFSTKENTYITVAIFGPFLAVLGGLHVLKMLTGRGGMLVPDGDSSHTEKQPSDGETGEGALPRFGYSAAEMAILVGSLVLPLATAFAIKIEPFLRIEPVPAQEYRFLAIVFVGTLALSAAIGSRWKPQRWLWCALIFWGIFATLHTTFFGNPEGFATGSVGALKYWLEQQGVARGGQPWFYYLVLLPLYDFIPVIFGLAGAVYFVARAIFDLESGVSSWLKRNLFPLFLIYWLIGSMVLYGWAAEKMPWLVLHMALPFTLLASMAIGRLVDAVPWGTWWRRSTGNGDARVLSPFYLAVTAVLTIIVGFTLWNRSVYTAPAVQPIVAEQERLQTLALAGILLACIGFGIHHARRVGLGAALRVLALAFLLGLLPFSIRAAWQVTYYNGDVPVEMMVYTQTSPDVGKTLREIERVGFRTGAGKELRVAYDSSVSWPFEWYLRDYKGRAFYSDGMPSAEAPVVLVGFENDHDSRVRPALGENYIGQRFKLRWWFPEDYREITPQGIWNGIGDPVVRRKVWNYLLYRETLNPLGSTDYMLYVRRDLAAGPWATRSVGAAVTRSPAVQAAPQVDPFAAAIQGITGAQLWGSKGTESSQFQEPKGVAVGPDGSVYVVDTGNHRVQKFDESGQFLLAWGQKGQAQGEFAEPWGIAVDASGQVFVADTWNHRIQKFDRDGKFLGAWGKYASVADGVSNPGDFYGPRGVAVDAAGFVYVADTGNHRIQKFDNAGELVAVAGRRGAAIGQFSEPVGLAVDREGAILVADTWNRRIQRLDANLTPVQQWPIVGWASTSVSNKPYLVVDGQGNVLATDPENNRVLQFSRDGSPLAAWGKPGPDLAALRLPTGLGIDPAGRVVVVDSLNNRIVRFGIGP
ncbi:MAG: TIGR03663 family protein [Chloroflexi bacterium]|nr:TIGR03663 family protein [Chloroflexota bacterium]